MAGRSRTIENQPEKCTETTGALVQAIYARDGETLLRLLSQGSRQRLQEHGITLDHSSLRTLADRLHQGWNCPPDRVLVLAADFDHPHLKGRVRVPIILDYQGSIPKGFLLPEGSPLPASCGALCVLLLKEGDEWKVDNIEGLAAGLC